MFHCLLLLQPLLYPELVFHPSLTLYLILAVGSAVSVSACHNSVSFIFFLVTNMLATWHADHLTILVCPHVPAAVCSVDTVLTVWQVVYLGLAVLLKNGREVQVELQAAYWEDLSLKIILRGCTAGSVSTWHTPLVI